MFIIEERLQVRLETLNVYVLKGTIELGYNPFVT